MKTRATTTNDTFTFLLRSNLGVEVVREYRFHPTRRWRFDYAIPSLRIAIEIDGGVWVGGRHNNPTGYLGDLDKFNAAATMGWVVLKFTPKQQYLTSTLDTIRTAVCERSKEQKAQ